MGRLEISDRLVDRSDGRFVGVGMVTRVLLVYGSTALCECWYLCVFVSVCKSEWTNNTTNNKSLAVTGKGRFRRQSAAGGGTMQEQILLPLTV